MQHGDLRLLKQSVWNKKKCDVCGDSRSEVLGQREYIWPTRHFRFEMKMSDALCLSCGFVFSETIPEESFLRSYYEDSFSIDSETTDIRPDFDPAKRLITIARFLKKGDSILEAGANRGDFCEILNSQGFLAQGFDPLDSKYGRHVQDRFLSGALKIEKAFDAVVSYYVLEHITNAKAWLLSLSSSLKQGGYLIFEVPNFETHAAESLNHEHFLHFTPSLLQRCVQSCGFEVLESGIQEPSRFFGFTLVAKKSGTAVPVFIDDQNKISIHRLIYQNAIKIKNEEQISNSAFSAYLASIPKDKETKFYFWGANEIATSIASMFTSLTSISPYLIDNAEDKVGLQHEGFSRVIAAPHFERIDHGSKVFVLCSPSYNAQIAEQIKQLELSNVLIVDVIKWRSKTAV